jgi:hypothetical protein
MEGWGDLDPFHEDPEKVYGRRCCAGTPSVKYCRIIFNEEEWCLEYRAGY